MAIKRKYTLVSSRVPGFEMKTEKSTGQQYPVITTDNAAGGIKLKYKVEEIEYKHKPILGGLFNIPIRRKLDETEEVYLKPFKKHIGRTKKDVPKEMWGPSNTPFSGIWVKVPDDYLDWSKIFSYVRLEECKEHKIIRHCNLREKQFVIEGEKDIIRPSIASLVIYNIAEDIKGLFKKSK